MNRLVGIKLLGLTITFLSRHALQVRQLSSLDDDFCDCLRLAIFGGAIPEVELNMVNVDGELSKDWGLRGVKQPYSSGYIAIGTRSTRLASDDG